MGWVGLGWTSEVHVRPLQEIKDLREICSSICRFTKLHTRARSIRLQDVSYSHVQLLGPFADGAVSLEEPLKREGGKERNASRTRFARSHLVSRSI